MLKPNDRTLIQEAVQPPAGYQLDHALVTTYSLDLTTLLSIPVALTFREWQEADDGTPATSGIGLLEALSENAQRLTVACQAGEIAVPSFRRNLFSFLEESVVPVSAPRGGVFHPKAFVLRYLSEDGPVRYRFLCASRNLTGDRSWDVLLALDGTVRSRERRARPSAGAAEFVAGVRDLIKRAPTAPSSARLEKIEQLEAELALTDFEAPDGLDLVAFHPLGVGGNRPDPFAGRRDRMLIISPFVAQPRLAALDTDRVDTLIGSQVELDCLPVDPAQAGTDVYVLDPATDEEPIDAESDPAPPPSSQLADASRQGLADSTDGLLRGLHAKVYVADCGWDARVWVGSANATQAAFESNVELLVELAGRKGRCGIDAILGTPDHGLRSLLQPYRRNEDATPDPDQQEAERLVDRVAHALGAARVVLRVTNDESAENSFTLNAVLPDESLALPSELTVRAWPVTLHPDRASDLRDPSDCRWQGLRSDQISAFLGLELTGRVGNAEVSRRRTLRCVVEGAPADRVGAVIRSILDSPEKLLRYLAFLLADVQGDPAAAVGIIELLASEPEPTEADAIERVLPTFPLLEGMVKALAQEPERLDRVARLLKEIRRAPNAEQLLPEGFEEVWKPVIEARAELVKR